ncbi:autotransporter outer membrane beta-barrel domain-containing protein, partial [Chimaeribacter californicus]
RKMCNRPAASRPLFRKTVIAGLLCSLPPLTAAWAEDRSPRVINDGAAHTLNNVDIYSDSGNAITLNNSSQLTLINSTLTVEGITEKGIAADGEYNQPPTLFAAENITVNVAGEKAKGIELAGHVTATLADAVISMRDGISALQSKLGATLSADNIQITVDNTARGRAPAMEVVDIVGTQALFNGGDIRVDTQGTLDVFNLSGTETQQGRLTLNDLTVAVNGPESGQPSYLINASGNSRVTVNGGDYTMRAGNGYGVWLVDESVQMDATDMTLTTEGTGAHAIDNRGRLTMAGSRITTLGNSSHALYTEANTDARDLVLSTAGKRSAAIAAARGGDVDLNGVSAATSGENSNLLLNFGDSHIAATALTGTASGDQADAIKTYANAAIALTDSQLTARGADAHGIIMLNDSARRAATTDITLDNSTIRSEQDAAISALGGGITLNLANSSQLTGGNGVLLETAVIQDAAGNLVHDEVTLNADGNSRLTGDVLIDAQAPQNNAALQLTNGSQWLGATPQLNQLTLDATSQWAITGDSRISQLALGGGTLAMQHSGDRYLTLHTGNLSGGGDLRLNTALAGNASATDRLVVAGEMHGDYQLFVNNRGGRGGLTTGDGINVIQVDGSSSGTVVLGQRVAVDAYDYFLYQGGEQDANDWYLRSTFTDEPVTPDDLPPDDPRPFPPAPQPDPDDVPWREEVPGYLAAPVLNQRYLFDALGTYHQRTGGDVAHLDGSWLRVFDQQQDLDSGRFGYDSETRYVQLGNDVYESRSNAATTRAGWVLTLGSQRTDAEDRRRALNPALSVATGRIESEIYSLGGYYTVQAEDGGYLDAIGQLSTLHNDYFSAGHSAQHGAGIAASIEAGKPFALGNRVMLEPQLQLKYQYLHLDGFNDEISAVSGVAQSSGEARAGLRLTRDIGRWQPYLTLDATTLIGDEPAVRVGSQQIQTEFSNSYWQTGLGVAATLSDSASAYGEFRYQQAFDRQSDGYAGMIGVKIAF